MMCRDMGPMRWRLHGLFMLMRAPYILLPKIFYDSAMFSRWKNCAHSFFHVCRYEEMSSRVNMHRFSFCCVCMHACACPYVYEGCSIVSISVWNIHSNIFPELSCASLWVLQLKFVSCSVSSENVVCVCVCMCVWNAYCVCIYVCVYIYKRNHRCYFKPKKTQTN